jgi:hypothetical protein
MHVQVAHRKHQGKAMKHILTGLVALSMLPLHP